MNEKIYNEILAESMLENLDGYSEYEQDSIMDFAELIVKECCNKLESTEIVHQYVAIFIANEIKEHFGIEYEKNYQTKNI